MFRPEVVHLALMKKAICLNHSAVNPGHYFEHQIPMEVSRRLFYYMCENFIGYKTEPWDVILLPVRVDPDNAFFARIYIKGNY